MRGRLTQPQPVKPRAAIGALMRIANGVGAGIAAGASGVLIVLGLDFVVTGATGDCPHAQRRGAGSL